MAFNIFVGALLLYLGWWIVSFLEMDLLSTMLGKFVGYGVLILIIIFQPELRKLLLMLGDNTLKRRYKFIEQFFGSSSEFTNEPTILAKEIALACVQLANSRSGALLVLTNDFLPEYSQTGHKIDAKVTAMLLENIFFKNAPMHDGAVIIKQNRILAAACILPVTERRDIPKDLGLRHRAAIGISEKTETLTIVVSEETGKITIVKKGELDMDISSAKLQQEITNYFAKE